MKALFKIIIISQLLLILPCSVYGLRLYSHAEYNTARDRAVQTARNGDLKSLLKLQPDNHGAFNDYLTILIWNEQYHNHKALQESQFLNLKETPEYLLRSLINAADSMSHQSHLLSPAIMRERMFVKPSVFCWRRNIQTLRLLP